MLLAICVTADLNYNQSAALIFKSAAALSASSIDLKINIWMTLKILTENFKGHLAWFEFLENFMAKN